MLVREAMTTPILAVGPGHSLREAATLMSARHVGAAIVNDPDGLGPGIITERDILDAVAHGGDVESERVADHLTADVVFASPDWSLEEAASAMMRGGFRHLIVVDAGSTVGVISVRDIVGACLTANRADPGAALREHDAARLAGAR
ncbi:MAG: CBS domain-containing protein [Acidobacteriota bacterium]|nr:CBS domain-containing protein [Acidobacteriota bacterium]